MKNKPRQPRQGCWGFVSSSQKLLQGRDQTPGLSGCEVPAPTFPITHVPGQAGWSRGSEWWSCSIPAGPGSPRSHFCDPGTEEQSTLPTWHLHWDYLVLEKPPGSQEGSFLIVTVLGGWNSAMLPLPDLCVVPSHPHFLLSFAAALQNLTHTEAAPPACPCDYARNGNDLMLMVSLFRTDCGDWGIRGQYCLNTFVLPFFSETLNHELPYTECSNWQL